MTYEWDPKKNQTNIRKHKVNFADAIPIFQEECAITIPDDSNEEEQRFVTLGVDGNARVLVVVYAYRDDTSRMISARLAESQERKQYEQNL